MNLNELIKNAKNSTVGEMLKLIDGAIDKLSNERKKMDDRVLFYLSPRRNAIIIGDLHGDIESLSLILKHSKFLENKNDYLVFLGDYGDRGLYSSEVYYVVLKLKENFSDRVILLRGNHEFPVDLPVSPHDLPVRLVEKYGEDGMRVYEKLCNLFDYFYNAAIVEKKYLFLHGGIPTEATSLNDIAFAHKTHPSKSYLEEILWSDPRDGIKGWYPSPRGAGRIFGPDITDKILRIMKVKILIRSHEPCEGVNVKHDGKILTVFSRKGVPYHNSCAAYLRIDLSEEVKNAYELSKMAENF